MKDLKFELMAEDAYINSSETFLVDLLTDLRDSVDRAIEHKNFTTDLFCGYESAYQMHLTNLKIHKAKKDMLEHSSLFREE